MARWGFVSISVIGVLVCAGLLCADQVSLPASADNTLYESATGSLSNGAGENLFAGRTGQPIGSFRRALIRFDVSTIPAGSFIQSVTLTLHCSTSSGGAQVMGLHRVLADWGESTSDAAPPEGLGAPAAVGDATWLHTFSPTSFWVTAGGDFVAGASASMTVDLTSAFYTWGSTPEMAADVQAWVDAPAINHGWVIVGNESVLNSAKRFESRENPNAAQRPVLVVTYLPMLPGDANCDGAVTVEDVPLFVEALLDASTYTGCDIGRVDVNGDGAVDGRDVESLVQAVF